MIALTPSGHAFIYWTVVRLVALDEDNYGRGKSHWIELLGKFSDRDCRIQYPDTPLLHHSDPRINGFIRRKIREMDELVAD